MRELSLESGLKVRLEVLVAGGELEWDPAESKSSTDLTEFAFR